jgi:hypothetical protein
MRKKNDDDANSDTGGLSYPQMFDFAPEHTFEGRY